MKKITICALICCLMFALAGCKAGESKAVKAGNETADMFIAAAENAGYEALIDDDIDELLKSNGSSDMLDSSIYEIYDRTIYMTKPDSDAGISVIYFDIYKEAASAKEQFVSAFGAAATNEAYEIDAPKYYDMAGNDLSKEVNTEDFINTENYSSFYHTTGDRYIHIIRKDVCLITIEVPTKEKDEVLSLLNEANIIQ